MRASRRVMRAALVLAARGPADPFGSIELVAVDRARAGGRPPGLYRVGAAGAAFGLLVYDPARGDPVVPAGRLAPHGLLIECHLADEDG